MFMTSEQKSALVFEGEVLSETSMGRTKYGEMTDTVVRANDGKLYRVDWVRGGTDYQEHDFFDSEVPEVLPFNRVTVKNTTQYLTNEERENTESFLEVAQKNVGSFQIVTGTDPSEIVTESIVENVEKILAILPDLKKLDLLANSGDWREATAQYLSMIADLAREKK